MSAPISNANTVSAISSPAFTPTMPQPRMRLLCGSYNNLVTPSLRPMDDARPLAAQGKLDFSYAMPCAFACVSVSPIQAISGSV